MNTIKNNIFVALAFSVALILLASLSVSAASTPTLNQTINSGTLATDILDSTRASVASPSTTFSAKTFSFECLYGGNAATGSLGNNNARLYVINPSGANAGWNLAMAATAGATALWQNSGSTQNYDFNDPTGANPGCTDGIDTDSKAGQLTINPSVSTLTTDCITCTSTNVTKGSSASYNQGTTDSITLLNAAAASDDIWRGYLTAVGMSQTIPAEQAVDTYSANMTITVTAN